MVTHKLDNWYTMHTAVVFAVWLTQAQSLSLCSYQVLQLWEDFGQKDEKAMKVLGETMGAFNLRAILRHHVDKKWGTDSDKKRLEDMMEVI